MSMRLIICLVTYMLVGLVAGAAGANAVVRIGIAAEPYPPFLVKDATGHWVGWEIDFMNAVCREMQENCEIVEVAWDGLIPSLQGNFIDVIWSSMSVTPERQKVIDFTDVYYQTPPGLIGRKDGDKDISAAHLQGKSIGVQISTVHQRYAAKHFGRSAIKTYQTADEVTQDLTAGRIDYILDNLVVLNVFLETAQGKECCELKGAVPRELEVFGLGVGGGVRKNDEQLKQRLNAAIKVVHDSGRYDAITKKYFAFDIWPN
jgi:polar amino acid transport system substrate-binding protein